MNQADLISVPQASSTLERIKQRLPQRDWLKVSDISAALDADKNTVYAWIDEGQFEVVDLGSGSSHFYKINRDSFLRFIQTRIIGA